MSGPTSSGDPIVDAVVAVVEELLATGAHLLDPETRKKITREAVAAELAKWPTIASGRESDRADEITRRHKIEVP